jgi:CubicO group peptidase (beta-lactamase class C family)
MKKKIFYLAVIIILTFISCKTGQEQETAFYSYSEPTARNDGWEVSSLSAQGIDASLIHDMIIDVKENVLRNVHGVLIIRHERLVLEEYFRGENLNGDWVGYDWDVRHDQMSCTKSFTSALIGIALDRGLLTGIDARLPDFFPDYAGLDWSGGKDTITVEHLLTMSAGLDWDEWTYDYLDSRNMHSQMSNSSDRIGFILSVPMAAEPGTLFVYNSGLSILLGEIIRRVSNLSADQFAEQYLFAPLGIEDYYWYIYPDGTVQAGGGLYLRPRDMAKLGQLYLNGGAWNGQRIVSAQWVALSGASHINRSNRGGYGYQWWTEQHAWQGGVIQSYSANGWGGQRIFVFPDLDMIVVFTGGNYFTSGNPPDTMLHRYILPAVN